MARPKEDDPLRVPNVDIRVVVTKKGEKPVKIYRVDIAGWVDDGWEVDPDSYKGVKKDTLEYIKAQIEHGENSAGLNEKDKAKKEAEKNK